MPPREESAIVFLVQLSLQLCKHGAVTAEPVGNMCLAANQLHRGQSPLSSEGKNSWSEAPKSVVGLGRRFTESNSGLWSPLGPGMGLRWGQSHWKHQSPKWLSVTSLLLGSHSCGSTTRLFLNVTKGFRVFSLHSDKFLIHAEANIHPVSRMTKLAPGRGGGVCPRGWARQGQSSESRPLDQGHCSHSPPSLQGAVLSPGPHCPAGRMSQSWG